MHPVASAAHARVRMEERQAEAARARLLAVAMPPPRVPLPERFAATRRALGYRLVEAGLRLVIDRVPPVPTVRPRIRG
ncbi:MAG: hypothetical protein GEU81_10760 [Nitriliruptorales bacterium]|nr:hypothetical protein [Nitriliruptorales bacterium]